MSGPYDVTEPSKDADAEHPVPDVWRPTFRAIVAAFARDDFELVDGPPDVAPVAPHTAAQMRGYIASYGEALTALPDETWRTSVSQWMDTHWEVLVDLWTLDSGCSDMVLDANVFETDRGFRVELHAVYVP
jgi:hypothetical protein